MKILIQTLFFLSICLAAGAQSDCSVKKAYAFYTVTTPGMAMMDENGNTISPPPTISRFIYLEWTGGEDPKVENVFYDEKQYTADISAIEGNSVIPGDGGENNEQYTVTINKCNRLWKIDIVPSPDPKTDKIESEKIVIRLKIKDKLCEITLPHETRLMSLPRY